MNHKLITLCTIVPTFLALTGTGLGLWVFRENIAEKNIKISMEVEPALVTSNFKAEWVSKKLTLDDSHKYMSGMIIKLSIDLEYLKGYLKTSNSSGEITSADVNGNINLSLNYTVSCTISKRESTLPCLNEFIKMTKVEEIIEGSENVVNDQYKENDPNDLTKGTHIDLAKSITFNTTSPTQTQAISTISPYFSYIKKASNTQEYSDMKKSIDNSLFTFTFTLNSVEEKTA